MSEEKCCYHNPDEECLCECHNKVKPVSKPDDFAFYWPTPASPNDGQVWRNSVTGKCYQRFNGQWEEYQFEYQYAPLELAPPMVNVLSIQRVLDERIIRALALPRDLVSGEQSELNRVAAEIHQEALRRAFSGLY